MRAVQIHKGIKLIGERDENQEIKDQIKKSSNLIIIGFSFDPNNLRILGFPENFLAAKQIAYLDYGGMMNSLHNALSSLSEAHQFSLIRSPRTSITDAYNYDLKHFSFVVPGRKLNNSL